MWISLCSLQMADYIPIRIGREPAPEAKWTPASEILSGSIEFSCFRGVAGRVGGTHSLSRWGAGNVGGVAHSFTQILHICIHSMTERCVPVECGTEPAAESSLKL